MIQKAKLEPWQRKIRIFMTRTWTYLSGGDEKQAATGLSHPTTIRGDQNIVKKVVKFINSSLFHQSKDTLEGKIETKLKGPLTVITLNDF